MVFIDSLTHGGHSQTHGAAVARLVEHIADVEADGSFAQRQTDSNILIAQVLTKQLHNLQLPLRQYLL